MKDGIKFVIRELKGVYVKREGKVYEVDWQGNEYFVPGLAISLMEGVWTIERLASDDLSEGYRTKYEIERMR